MALSFILQSVPETGLCFITIPWMKAIVEANGLNPKEYNTNISGVFTFSMSSGVGIGYIIGGLLD